MSTLLELIRTRRCIGSLYTRNANSLLEQEVDNLQQYQCHTCIIVDGITPVKDGWKGRTNYDKMKKLLNKKFWFLGKEGKWNEMKSLTCHELDMSHCHGKAKDKEGWENNP